MFQDGKLCGQDFEALRQGCIDNGELFTDPEFPPDDQSLYFSQETPFAFEWKRASEITDGACLFEGGATRFDINQGELGDCWLLAALANLTLNKRLLYQGKLACTRKRPKILSNYTVLCLKLKRPQRLKRRTNVSSSFQ